ncbi:YsnF/AvaK domain-containing protein, partial [Dankookia rubra]|uniref:YsnF/AvaK domain-containing protein n=1 Tax=Dankookia rubra TaxID=1442381 RepID=UPI0019D66D0B
MEQDAAEQVIPLLEERLRIAKQWRDTGRVRVSVTTAEDSRLVEEVLRQRSVEVERVPIGRQVAELPSVREEGDTLVIPVVEEELVVERRLVLREEVRVRLRTEDRRAAVPVTLRRQSAAIERLPPHPAPGTGNKKQERHVMRTITGLFDSRPEAERAVQSIIQEHGLGRDRVQIHAASDAGRDTAQHGVPASLRTLPIPEQDRVLYQEGIRRGGVLVSAEVAEAMVWPVGEALERHGAVDLDAREAEWHASGPGGGPVTGAAGAGGPGAGAAGTDVAGAAGEWTGGGGLIGGRSAGSSATQDSLPAVNPDASGRGWTGGGGAIGSTASTRDTPEQAGVGSTYAGTSYIGARSTDEDITKPINAGIASSPPVRPAGPAALAAAGAGASTSALRGSERDVTLAASVGNEGPGTGAGPAAGSAAAGQAP